MTGDLDPHPSDDVLLAWLESGRAPGVDEHLARCETCLDRLDELTDLGEVRTELDAVTEPPEDLAGRTSVGVRGRLSRQEAVSVVAEMLTLPFRTLSVLLDDGVPARGRPRDETAGEDGETADG